VATIDLGPPRPAPHDLLDGLPRRVPLTLPELRLVAERAGDAPLPFELRDDAAGTETLDDRLGQSPAVTEQAAYRETLSRLHDPSDSLARRGLIGAGGDIDQGLLGAVGLLATPTVALDLDVTAGGVQAKAWHRQSRDAVAALSTQDGVVFELAWFPIWAWGTELSRVAVIPEDVALRESHVPGVVDLPHELADAAIEAVASNRRDLVDVLVAQHSGQVTDDRGAPLPDADVTRLLSALATEAQGRLRALVADVSGGAAVAVGVTAWTLVGDGWRALRPHDVEGLLHLRLSRVIPEDLAADLAPVLAQVTGAR
jgi:hypothetical protein